MAKQITPIEATDLCNNFDEKYRVLCTQKKSDDNRSILFPLSELKAYLDYLENSNKNIDGIRVYFGAYKEDDLSTVFLAPTKKDEDEKSLNCFNFGQNGNPKNKKY
ncbi:hypothetical protein [Lutibacter sp.]